MGKALCDDGKRKMVNLVGYRCGRLLIVTQ